MAVHASTSSNDHDSRRTRPWRIGLIGGIASGKSTVARRLAEHGALWLDCDKIAHEVLDEPDVVTALRNTFSAEILDSGGHVDRKRLARCVFGDEPNATTRRRRLEELVHPRVRARAEQQIEAKGDRYPAILIDAPLLIEAGWSDWCDRILLVDTPLELRRQFAAARGWSKEEFDKRESSQMPLHQKRAYATDTLRNAGTLEDLIVQVDHFWKNLLNSTAPSTP